MLRRAPRAAPHATGPPRVARPPLQARSDGGRSSVAQAGPNLLLDLVTIDGRDLAAVDAREPATELGGKSRVVFVAMVGRPQALEQRCRNGRAIGIRQGESRGEHLACLLARRRSHRRDCRTSARPVKARPHAPPSAARAIAFTGLLVVTGAALAPHHPVAPARPAPPRPRPAPPYPSSPPPACRRCVGSTPYPRAGRSSPTKSSCGSGGR